MSQRIFLGEFELFVLLAVIRLGESAYGVPIADALQSFTGREVSLGSVYGALERLERGGLISSRIGEITPERGGRAKRYFDVTKSGIQRVRQTRAALVNLWEGMPLTA